MVVWWWRQRCSRSDRIWACLGGSIQTHHIRCALAVAEVACQMQRRDPHAVPGIGQARSPHLNQVLKSYVSGVEGSFAKWSGGRSEAGCKVEEGSVELMLMVIGDHREQRAFIFAHLIVKPPTDAEHAVLARVVPGRWWGVVVGGAGGGGCLGGGPWGGIP